VRRNGQVDDVAATHWGECLDPVLWVDVGGESGAVSVPADATRGSSGSGVGTV